MAEPATFTAGAPVARSPLAHRQPLFTEDGRASLAEWPFRTLITLRGEPEMVAVAVEQATRVPVPTTPLTSAAEGERSWLWLGPDEWLFVGPEGEADRVLAAIDPALSATPHQAVDVSDHFTTVTVGGREARALLARLITVDLDRRVFPKGKVVRTLAGPVPVVLWLRDESETAGPQFDVLVRASMADHFWCLAADAGRTFGLPAATPRAGEPMRP